MLDLLLQFETRDWFARAKVCSYSRIVGVLAPNRVIRLVLLVGWLSVTCLLCNHFSLSVWNCHNIRTLSLRQLSLENWLSMQQVQASRQANTKVLRLSWELDTASIQVLLQLGNNTHTVAKQSSAGSLVCTHCKCAVCYTLYNVLHAIWLASAEAPAGLQMHCWLFKIKEMPNGAQQSRYGSSPWSRAQIMRALAWTRQSRSMWEQHCHKVSHLE